MIVKYDEENFSIKLYRDFVKGKLVGLMEVIPIDELLEVWADRKTENNSEKPNNCDEPTWEQVKDYCNKRCLDIVDSGFVQYLCNMQTKSQRDECEACSYPINCEETVCQGCCRKRIAEQTEPNCSEKPNNCETQTDWHYDEQDATWYPYKHEDEPQTDFWHSVTKEDWLKAHGLPTNKPSEKKPKPIRDFMVNGKVKNEPQTERSE